MRALVVSQPGRIVLEQRPDPHRGTGEVLLRITRAGICGTDYHIFGGTQPFLSYPRLIGHELAATVVEAGVGSRFRAGQGVVVNPYVACGTCRACRQGLPNCCMRIGVLGVHRDGGMCDLIALPEANLIDAAGLTPDQAASIEYLAIGAHAVRRSGAGQGHSALVIGSGPIGLATALFARLAGASVLLADRDGDRLAQAAALTGLATVTAGDDFAAAMAAATAGDGFDRVFDATGNRASMEAGFAHVAHGGTYTLVGLVRDDITFADPEFHKREMTLMASRNATDQDFAHVMAAVRSGAVPAAALVTHRTTLDRAATDLPHWHRDKRGLVKAMIEVS